MALKQHENLLAVYPEILGRLKTVKGIKAVKEIGELAELLAQGAVKRKAAPLDGAVYVVYGGSTFADEAKNGKFLKSTLHFTFVFGAKLYRQRQIHAVRGRRDLDGNPTGVFRLGRGRRICRYPFPPHRLAIHRIQRWLCFLPHFIRLRYRAGGKLKELPHGKTKRPRLNL